VARDLRILGDLPIFVADDSADVWGARELFQLDADGAPTVGGGVPPDYFSATAQLWGNPLYAWEAHAARGFDWWIARLRAALRFCDVVRVDHFIGFTRYWAIPAGAATAVHGTYRPAPGTRCSSDARGARRRARSSPRTSASSPRRSTRCASASPARHARAAVRVSTSDATNRVPLPHRYQSNSVVYTGTHDNDTTVGWFHTRRSGPPTAALRYLGRRSSAGQWSCISFAWRWPRSPTPPLRPRAGRARPRHRGRA
jgi:4-alpha-glucanotransferase